MNVFEKDFILIPVNDKFHWTLAVVCYPRYMRFHLEAMRKQKTTLARTTTAEEKKEETKEDEKKEETTEEEKREETKEEEKKEETEEDEKKEETEEEEQAESAESPPEPRGDGAGAMDTEGEDKKSDGIVDKKSDGIVEEQGNEDDEPVEEDGNGEKNMKKNEQEGPRTLQVKMPAASAAFMASLTAAAAVAAVDDDGGAGSSDLLSTRRVTRSSDSAQAISPIASSSSPISLSPPPSPSSSSIKHSKAKAKESIAEIPLTKEEKQGMIPCILLFDSFSGQRGGESLCCLQRVYVKEQIVLSCERFHVFVFQLFVSVFVSIL